MEKTTLISLQFALFFKNIVERPDSTFEDINKNMLNIFDDIPQILPIPAQLPPEIPVVTRKSKKGDYVCNIARSRIDLICQRTDDETENIELLKDFNAKVNAYVKYVLQQQEAIRFGMIARYFHKDDGAVSTIRKKYFSPPLENISELSLRFNQNDAFLDFKINDIVEISAANATLGVNTSKGILIQRDINNAPEKNRILSHELLLKLSERYAQNITQQKIEELIK